MPYLEGERVQELRVSPPRITVTNGSMAPVPIRIASGEISRTGCTIDLLDPETEGSIINCMAIRFLPEGVVGVFAVDPPKSYQSFVDTRGLEDYNGMAAFTRPVELVLP